MVGAGRRGRARVAGGDPGDVRAVERRLAVERELAAGLPEPGPGKARATITFGVVNVVLPFGKPGGYA